MTLPEIVWEASFAIDLVAKGFKTPTPFGSRHESALETVPAVA